MPCADVHNVQGEKAWQNVSRRISLLHRYKQEIKWERVAMGTCKNTLGNIVKAMCEEAGIQGRKVNHSARKTAITTLVHAGISPTLVQQHSGHKSLASINNYSTASLNQQKDMSDLLTSHF